MSKIKKIFNKFIFIYALCLAPCILNAATVVATVNGVPITDTDITARTKLMAAQGQNYTDNRKRALNNIIDDNVKLKYAENFKVTPSDDDVKKEIKAMSERGLNLSALSATEMEMAKYAVRANIAWQIIIARTIVPTISVSKEEIATEIADLEREQGLPVEVTFIRLVNIPESVAKNLTTPKDCDAAVKMAEKLGGAPQKLTAPQYELSSDIRARMAGLSELKWSSRIDGTVLLVCKKKKMKEFEKLDEIIEQNAVFKKAMFAGDQQLKQLRRKAVIVINDKRYSL
ncbi:MAG: SurA N-terminal domain-containing protein [Alphaproteobacteria bacterium]|nr:SurA N-terminal domain-containing protein [Alphaproteobacteria bacterium]